MSLLPKHKYSVISASGSVVAVPASVYGVSLQAGAGAAGKVSLFNNTDGSGSALFSIGAPATEFNSQCFSEFGPIVFDTALYAAMSGSAAAAYLWHE